MFPLSATARLDAAGLTCVTPQGRVCITCSVTLRVFLCLHHPTVFDLCPPSFPSSVPSAPPQDVCLHSLSSTSIRVSWVAPPTHSHHRKVVGYALAYQAVTGQDVQRHQVAGIAADLTSYVLEDLDKWTEYLVWVRAHTDVGPGPESPAALIRTLEDGMLMMTPSNPIQSSLIQSSPV